LLLKEMNSSGAVSITTMQFFIDIQTDLSRFKWLAGRLK
jgi:hypothetical protein